MEKLIFLQLFSGLIWFIAGLLIIIWLLNPSELLMIILWWFFAGGCVLTGLWMLIEPFSR